MDLVLNSGRVISPSGARDDVSVSIVNGRIVDFGDRHSPGAMDLSRRTVFPGFIDIHVHGAMGVDVNSAGVDDLVCVAAFLARNGVTAWLPTLVPDTDENYKRAIEAIDRLMEVQNGLPIAQALGVHYEGPFVNESMCGALRSKYFKTGATNRHEGPRTHQMPLPRLRTGVHMTTLAPEIDGGIELINDLIADGWIVAIGHTRATPGILDQAFDAGARHLTHFFNAMSGIHHRAIGVAGWGLSRSGVTFDIIADGHHVDLQMLKFACRAKGSDDVLLISDSVAPTGLGEGVYELWDEKISVTNGRTFGLDGHLAGSVITMADAVRQMRRLGFGDDQLAKMTSANPARLVGLDQERGSIETGKRADLVAVDEGGNIVLTMVGGQVVPNENKG